MLKKRVIPTMLLLGKRLVKGTKFSNHIDVGNPSTTMRGFNAQNPDEICLINLNSDKDSFSFLVNTVASVAEECRVPITIGGGIDSVAKVKALIKSGADKVFVNSGLHYHKQLMSEISEEVGGQALVAGIDYKYINGKPVVVFRNGEETTALHPLDYAESIFRYVSCEIFLTCVDRDGVRMGYDIALLKNFTKQCPSPVIASGGAGNIGHIVELFNLTDASAASCGSLFYFADNNPMRIKSYLRNNGIPARPLH